MRKIIFEEEAFEELTTWATLDKKVHKRIATIILETIRSPFEGLGKPEPLKHQLKGCWSRRITGEHRLIYRVTDDAIVIMACMYHYEK
jgi:toxin YoeB